MVAAPAAGVLGAGAVNGCVVRWNREETSWDCPCHGSRFDAYGKVVNGPSNADLAPADVPPAASRCAEQPETETVIARG